MPRGYWRWQERVIRPHLQRIQVAQRDEPVHPAVGAQPGVVALAVVGMRPGTPPPAGKMNRACTRVSKARCVSGC